MSQKDITLNDTLADVVLDLPREFSINGKGYHLWSPTLGMSILIERKMRLISIDKGAPDWEPTMEVLRICASEKEKVCDVLSVYTFREYDDFLCVARLEERKKELMALDVDELASLFLYTLSMTDATRLMHNTGLEKDIDKQREIAGIKNKEGHSVTFGGKTLYGQLIDAACARYGWSKKYAVWGIDLVSLRMMLADSLNSVYLTDEERKSLKVDQESDIVIGMDEAGIEKLKSMDLS